MLKSKWILLFLFSTLSLSAVSSSYEANQAGMSFERLQKIAPTLTNLYLKTGKCSHHAGVFNH